MAIVSQLIFSLALVTSTDAIQRIVNDHAAGVEPNMPGSPDTTSPWDGAYPFMPQHSERQKWGERLLAASAAGTSPKSCGGFMSYGDFTWCAAAMPKEVESVKNGLWGPQLLESASAKKRPAGDASGFVGISYGIRERDMWSEFLSNRYHVPTKLYDCYWKEDRGPMGTKDFHAKAMGAKECPSWRKVDSCYAAEYEPKHVCLDLKKPFLMTDDGRNLTFGPMSTALAGQAPLSVFLKMDIEGSEWAPLEWLLSNKAELAKIRTLDMEAHMQYLTEGGQQYGDTQIERKVKVMEGLAKHFAVVGSTINHEHMKQKKRWQQRLAKDAKDVPEEPRVYARNGLFLDRYSISFVSRKVLE